METDTPPLIVILLFGVILFCAIAGMILHFLSRKYVIGGEKWQMRKDSLMRRREEIMEPKGKRMVKAQKTLFFIMLASFLGIAAIMSNK